MTRSKKVFQKIICSVLMLTLVLTGSLQADPTNVQAASSNTKAKAAYSKFLSQPVSWVSGTCQPSDLKFGLTDINNDGISELYVYKKTWDYDSKARLYGYVGGKVKLLYTFGRYSKLSKIYPSKGVFTSYASGLKYNSKELIHIKYSGGKTYKKATRFYNGRLGNYQYSGSSGSSISSSTYNSIVSSLVGSASSKGAPTLYSNTSTNRKKKLGTVKPKFQNCDLYAYSNGGFYLKVRNVSSKKMSISFRMPNMSVKNISATISSDGKTATAKFYCSKGKLHTLKLSVLSTGIRVKETSSCAYKLLISGTYSPKTVTHDFFPESYYYM